MLGRRSINTTTAYYTGVEAAAAVRHFDDTVLKLRKSYTLTQVPGGDAGALRLTMISIAISMLALLAAEFLARRLSRILPGT